MSKPTVVLADDHAIVTAGLKSLLEPEFELLEVVENGRDLVRAVEKRQPDVVIADISMPLLNGIEATTQIKKSRPKTCVVILTMHPDVTYATWALEAGASGFVLKHSAPEELVIAVRAALRGEVYITPLISPEALQAARDQYRRRRKKVVELTSRQREILQILAEGKSAKEAAAVLNISPRTVESHKYRMMEDLGLKTTAELIQYAIKHGIVSVEA